MALVRAILAVSLLKLKGQKPAEKRRMPHVNSREKQKESKNRLFGYDGSWEVERVSKTQTQAS